MIKFVGTGPFSYEKRIYRAAVSQRLRNTALYHGTVLHPEVSLSCVLRLIIVIGPPLLCSRGPKFELWPFRRRCSSL